MKPPDRGVGVADRELSGAPSPSRASAASGPPPLFGSSRSGVDASSSPSRPVGVPWPPDGRRW